VEVVYENDEVGGAGGGGLDTVIVELGLPAFDGELGLGPPVLELFEEALEEEESGN
jgi:hypothetical protein